MEEYNKIIESLGVRYIKAKRVKIFKPITVTNFYDVENTVVLLHKGEVSYGKEKTAVKPGQILFIPGGKSAYITYGSGKPDVMSNDDFINKKEKYLQPFVPEAQEEVLENFSYVTLEAKVFDSVNFFASLDIDPFIIEENPAISHLIHAIIAETHKELPGKERVIMLNTDQLVVEIIRYIVEKKMFVEQLATNSTYFKDPRLIDIFSYIKDNLNGDLSNKILASVANVSEDYVGQYFKMLTGINPQDYIEYQRMEAAVNLLRTSKKSIREIGREVGYKDTAYFCRRFKMMFGIPAGKMRRRESLMNV